MTGQFTFITSLLFNIYTVVIALSGFCVWLLIRFYRHKKLVEQLLTEQELMACRAQLDPHMLQNTFEIMASHIVNESPDTAVSFIRTISSFFRQVLLTSDKSIVTLEEELEFTEKYLSVQQSITGNRYRYSITVDEEVDTYGVQVPAMLFQPILENSIKHGFTGTALQDGYISVSLEQQDNYILCTIKDNGAGFQKTPSSSKHISKGLALTEKRLQLLFKHFKHKPQMQVISNDLCGVSTILRIPV